MTKDFEKIAIERSIEYAKIKLKQGMSDKSIYLDDGVFQRDEIEYLTEQIVYAYGYIVDTIGEGNFFNR